MNSFKYSITREQSMKVGGTKSLTCHIFSEQQVVQLPMNFLKVFYDYYPAFVDSKFKFNDSCEAM